MLRKHTATRSLTETGSTAAGSRALRTEAGSYHQRATLYTFSGESALSWEGAHLSRVCLFLSASQSVEDTIIETCPSIMLADKTTLFLFSFSPKCSSLIGLTTRTKALSQKSHLNVFRYKSTSSAGRGGAEFIV